MIDFPCECGQLLRVPDEQRGRPVLCPKCRKQCTVPGVELVTAEPVAVEPVAVRPDIVEEERPRRPRRSDDRPDDRRGDGGTEPPKSRALLYTMIALGGVALVGCVMCVPLMLLFPAVQKIRGAAARMSSSNNEKMLLLAMLNYNDNYGHFPQAYDLVQDGAGGPKKEGMSWRIALLPYIEQANLYNSYVPEQPWDSPINTSIQAVQIKTYRDPSDESMPKTGTVYQVFVTAAGKSPHSMFNHPTDQFNHVTTSSIIDGSSNTIMIAEAATSVPWYTPRDMPFDPNQSPPALGNLHYSGSVVGLADASVKFLPPSVSPTTLKALITRDGDEPISDPGW